MYKLLPAQEGQEDLQLYFRMGGEAAERHGAIGCFSVNFGKIGSELRTKWYNYQPHLKTSAFMAEFDKVIYSLRDEGRNPPFASRANLEMFCFENFGASGGGGMFPQQKRGTTTKTAIPSRRRRKRMIWKDR